MSTSEKKKRGSTSEDESAPKSPKKLQIIASEPVFKMSPAKSVYAKKETVKIPTRDSKVFTVHGKPGYVLAYVMSPNGTTKGFDLPFYRMIKENNEKIHHLKITHIVERKKPGTDETLFYGRFWQNMYLSPCDIQNEEQLGNNAASFGKEVADILSGCDYQFDNTFVYGGDVSEPGGTAMHKVLLRKDQIRFCKSSFEEHLKNDEFLTNEALMTSIFGSNLTPTQLKEMLA